MVNTERSPHKTLISFKVRISLRPTDTKIIIARLFPRVERFVLTSRTTRFPLEKENRDTFELYIRAPDSRPECRTSDRLTILIGNVRIVLHCFHVAAQRHTQNKNYYYYSFVNESLGSNLSWCDLIIEYLGRKRRVCVAALIS